MRTVFLMSIFHALASTVFSQASNSVLSTGSWYKLGVIEDGIYKITYNDLVSMGIPVASIDPRHRKYDEPPGHSQHLKNTDAL